MFDFLLISKRAVLVFGTSVTLAGGSPVNTARTLSPISSESNDVGQPPVLSSFTNAADPVPSVIRLDLPVAWQLTRVRDATSNPSMVTESFRETWTIEQRPSGEIFLQSPRARVSAFAMGGSELSSRLPIRWPKLLMIPEVEFARLVGVPEPSDTEANDQPESRNRFVSLALRPARATTDVTLRLAEEQSVEIQVEIGSQVLF